ncbi:MAG: hypothetical protein FWG64_02965 [Firmicutes bacterium]|nr:hypothetical protein [Bacillota bacterium]
MKHRNQTTGITFDIPANWQFLENPADPECIAYILNKIHFPAHAPSLSIVVEQELTFYPTKKQFNQRLKQRLEQIKVSKDINAKFGSIDGDLFGNKQGYWFRSREDDYRYIGYKYIWERMLSFTLLGCIPGKVPKDVTNDYIKIMESAK